MPTQKITRTQLPGALKAHAIIIAINKYEKIGAHLRTPIADGEALKNALITYQSFGEENVHICYDPKKAELEDFLAGLKKNATIGVKDALLFYYAGHGLAGDIDGAGAAGYLMPSDVSFSKVELSKNKTLIEMEWLFEQLESFECHHTLAIMDCCFAGAFRRISSTRATMGLGLRPMSKQRFNRYQEKRAWQVLASAGPAEKAADLISERGETAKNSPFAQALVKVLSGKAHADFKPAGKNLGDGVLTAHELFIFLHDEVERRTRKAAAFKPQNPDLFPMGRHDGGQFIFCDPRHPQNQPDWDTRKRKNPFKGLAQYDLADEDYYFGRTSDVENLKEIIGLTPSLGSEEEDTIMPTLLLVTGPSGSGKSSLVKAGILPALLRNAYEVFQFRPGDRPWSLQRYQHQAWQEVKTANDQPFRFVPPTDSVATPLDFPLNAAAPQILYIDQFEELFTTCTVEEQTTLNTYLVDLLKAARDRKLKIIVSMRSDFEWQLELSSFGAKFWKKQADYYDYFKLYRLTALRLDDLRTALVHPASLFAYEFQQDEEGDLTDSILEDLNYLPSALPLLSYTMQEMVRETSITDRVFQRATYRHTIGGVSGALSTRMQNIYDALKPSLNKELIPAVEALENANVPKQGEKTPPQPASPEQELLRTLFLRMVSLSDGDYVRRRIYRDRRSDELRFAVNNDAIEKILDALRKANLISTGGDAGVRYEELIHDSLINTWTTGKQWINDFGKENLSLHRELWQAVRQSRSVTREHQLDTDNYEQAQSTADRSLVQEGSRLSHYWDTNPKLLQLISRIANDSYFLLQQDQEKFIHDILGNFHEEDREILTQFFSDCHAKGEFPDLNSLILSGHSEMLLEMLLQKGKHHLNLAEIHFVKTSWSKRIKDILDLKRQRDEAQAAQERTATEMIEASWKTGVYLTGNSNNPNISYDVDDVVGGVRNMYAQLKNIMSLRKAQSLSPIPIFLSGPHTDDYNLNSEVFGHYNPEFLVWAKARIVPATRNSLLRKFTQPFYDEYLRDMARAYYLGYLHLEEQPILFEKRLAVYADGGTFANGENNYDYNLPGYTSPDWHLVIKVLSSMSGHYFFVSLDFWVRRRIDTTAIAFFEILTELLGTYDQKWLDEEVTTEILYDQNG